MKQSFCRPRLRSWRSSWRRSTLTRKPWRRTFWNWPSSNTSSDAHSSSLMRYSKCFTNSLSYFVVILFNLLFQRKCDLCKITFPWSCGAIIKWSHVLKCFILFSGIKFSNLIVHFLYSQIWLYNFNNSNSYYRNYNLEHWKNYC